MKKLSEILSVSLNRAGIGRQVTAAMICQYFTDALQELNANFAANARPVHYRNRVLMVDVEGAPLASEMQMLNEQLLAKINAKAGENLLERIVFRIK